jgi:hypothetical protein
MAAHQTLDLWILVRIQAPQPSPGHAGQGKIECYEPHELYDLEPRVRLFLSQSVNGSNP